MLIEGLFKIETLEDSIKGTRELNFTFTEEFKTSDLEKRIATVKNYIQQLTSEMNQTSDIATQQGMLTVLQITQQILPHIIADEIPLDETIVVEMGENADGSSLSELIDASKLQ